MERSNKEKFANDYIERIKTAKIAVLADFRGVEVEKINIFRTRVRQAGGMEFRVGKNTLFRRVFTGTPWAVLDPYLKGPTGILLGDADIVETAKLVTDFEKEVQAFEIKAGFAEGRLMDIEGLKALSKMPSKDQLRSQFLSVLQAVPRKFLRLAQAPSRNFVCLLENYRKKQAGEE